MLFVFGVNPSYATDKEPDLTISKVISYCTQLNQLDGWLMLNLYPQRTRDPKKLADKLDMAIHNKNLQVIRNYVSRQASPVIWAAWGNLITERTYLKECLTAINNELLGYHPRWQKIGDLTKVRSSKTSFKATLWVVSD
jgi:hypothetical protein